MSNSISSGTNDAVLKSILKYKDHSSLKAIEKISKLNGLFKFPNVENWKYLMKL